MIKNKQLKIEHGYFTIKENKVFVMVARLLQTTIYRALQAAIVELEKIIFCDYRASKNTIYQPRYIKAVPYPPKTRSINYKSSAMLDGFFVFSENNNSGRVTC